MSSNSFGRLFRITTWGESHGKAIGVVIDGCPAGLAIDLTDIQQALDKRAPGKHPLTSPRKEADKVELLCGVFQGQSTGAPISLMIANRDADSSAYHPTKDLIKPGHATFTYQQKYGVFDYRGGGRASARETASRVAAGAVAQALLSKHGIAINAYLQQVGEITATHPCNPATLTEIDNDPLNCVDPEISGQMATLLETVKSAGDSIGGVVGFVIHGLAAGLGDPVYGKLEALLAAAMLSLPASKGFEIGEGFAVAEMRGSEHNDRFVDKTSTATNHAGGTLGGISTGMPLFGRVAFKPTASIAKPQATIDSEGQAAVFEQPTHARHDPCVAIRAVPVVKAMCQLVMADVLLMRWGQQHD